MRLNKESAVLVIIDIQERLLPVIENRDQVENRTRVLLEGAMLLDLPVIFSEQYPRGLGKTIETLKPWINEKNVYEKTSFSLLDDLASTMESLFKEGKSQFILAGIESHVCVYQTARDLLEAGKEVIIAYDAVGSRQLADSKWALESLGALGALVLPSETIIFDLQRTAKSPTFKAISQLIK